MIGAEITMSNVPRISLTDSSLTLFKLAISGSDPWPFSLMGGDHHKTNLLNNFHLHFPHLHLHHHKKDIPKGCLAVMVGQGEEKQQRIIIPVIYINHPLFMQLLKEAEEEYGFDQKGPITIPCHVEQFLQVQGMIDQDKSHHHHHHHLLCFKV